MQVLLFLIIILAILFLVPFHGEIGGVRRWMFNVKKIWGIFWTLIAVFTVSLLGFVPGINELLFGPIFALLFVSFVVLGTTLVLLTWRSSIQGQLRISLMLTGASPVVVVVTFIIGSILDGVVSWGGETGNFIIFAFFAVFIISAITSVVLKRSLQ